MSIEKRKVRQRKQALKGPNPNTLGIFGPTKNQVEGLLKRRKNAKAHRDKLAKGEFPSPAKINFGSAHRRQKSISLPKIDIGE